MPTPLMLDPTSVKAWLAKNPSWQIEDEGIARRFRFADYAQAVGFLIRVAMLGEKRNHHPVMKVTYGKTKVVWYTNDVDAITQLDLDLAEETDRLAI